MKFDPITEKKKISSLEKILKSGNYIEIPAYENSIDKDIQEQEK